MLRLNDKYLVDGTGAEHRRAQLHSAPLAHALVRNFNVYQRTMRAEMRRVRRRMTVLWRNIKPVKVSSLGVFWCTITIAANLSAFWFCAPVCVRSPVVVVLYRLHALLNAQIGKKGAYQFRWSSVRACTQLDCNNNRRSLIIVRGGL